MESEVHFRLSPEQQRSKNLAFGEDLSLPLKAENQVRWHNSIRRLPMIE
jgi:hypothetical protein